MPEELDIQESLETNPNIPEKINVDELLNDSSITEPKKKRGRPPKDPNSIPKDKAEKEAVIMLASFFGIVCSIPFSVLARNRGEHWNLTKQESEQLSIAVQAVATKHISSIGTKYAAELLLIAVTVSITMPRLYIDIELKKQRLENESR